MEEGMKRFMTILALALTTAACQQEKIQDAAEESGTFHGCMEQFGATRTHLVGNTVRWDTGDRVGIFEGYSYSNPYTAASVSENGASCSFTPDADYPAQEVRFPYNIALYPYTADATILGSDGKSRISGIELKAVQEYRQESFARGCFPMVAVTGSLEDKNLNFKNICGVLKVTLKGSERIRSLALSGNDGEGLAGEADVWVSQTGVPEIILDENPSKTVTIDCTGQGVALQKTAGTSFLFPLPPMTFSKGFTVTAVLTDGTTHTISTENSQTIDRSAVLAMEERTLQGETPDLEEPDPESISGWGVVGTFNNWGQDGQDVSMTREGDWLVAHDVSLNTDNAEFKFRKNKSWNENYGSKGSDEFAHEVDVIYENPSHGGPNIVVPKAGTYDICLSIYFDEYYYTAAE